MAIFRFEAKIISRRAKTKAGKPIPGRTVSVVAKAAYRAGDKLHDDRYAKDYNYRSRAQEVIFSDIVYPNDAPTWLIPIEGEGTAPRRERLWNEIERAEKRVDSQLAREFVIALPRELNQIEQAGLLRAWCQEHVTSQGFVADFAMHRSKDGNNPHAHVLCTLRPVEDEGFGKKPDMSGKFGSRGHVGHGAKSDLERWRESWADHCNQALEAAGSDARVDHRSLADQGIDREPEPKIGTAATGMQRRGAEVDPDRVRDARQTRMENELRAEMRSVQTDGLIGLDSESEATWLSRLSGTFSHLYVEAKELWRDESSGARAVVEKPQEPPHPPEGEPAASMASGSQPRPPEPRSAGDQHPRITNRSIDIEPEH